MNRLHVILTTHTDASGGTPYSSDSVWRPFVDALVKAGVRTLEDVLNLDSEKVPGVSTEVRQWPPPTMHRERVLHIFTP